VFTVDFTVSFQAALDLKELLISLRDNNEEIRRLEKRFEVVVAVVDSEREQFKEKVGQHVEQSRERLEQGREYLAQSRERLEQGREALEQEHEYLSKGRDRIGAARERLEQKLRGYTERLEELEQIYRDRYEKENGEGQTGEKLRSELDELRARISGIYRRLPERKTRRNKHIRTLLKRNPGAVSLKFPNWLEQLREENEENQQEKS
jgi:chromosome segregation ATPase